jgi:hypothetical protein
MDMHPIPKTIWRLFMTWLSLYVEPFTSVVAEVPAG